MTPLSQRTDLINLSKEVIISKIHEKVINMDNIVYVLQTMKTKNKILPTFIKMGDVFTIKELGNHRCLVIKTTKDLVYSLMITSNENTTGIIEPTKSRFYSALFITSTLIIKSKDYAIANYENSFENNKQVLQVKKTFKLTMKNL